MTDSEQLELPNPDELYSCCEHCLIKPVPETSGVCPFKPHTLPCVIHWCEKGNTKLKDIKP